VSRHVCRRNSMLFSIFRRMSVATVQQTTLLLPSYQLHMVPDFSDILFYRNLKRGPDVNISFLIVMTMVAGRRWVKKNVRVPQCFDKSEILIQDHKRFRIRTCRQLCWRHQQKHFVQLVTTSAHRHCCCYLSYGSSSHFAESQKEVR
jgi:hypothetical protein